MVSLLDLRIIHQALILSSSYGVKAEILVYNAQPQMRGGRRVGASAAKASLFMVVIARASTIVFYEDFE